MTEKAVVLLLNMRVFVENLLILIRHIAFSAGKLISSCWNCDELGSFFVPKLRLLLRYPQRWRAQAPWKWVLGAGLGNWGLEFRQVGSGTRDGVLVVRWQPRGSTGEAVGPRGRGEGRLSAIITVRN